MRLVLSALVAQSLWTLTLLNNLSVVDALTLPSNAGTLDIASRATVPHLGSSSSPLAHLEVEAAGSASKGKKPKPARPAYSWSLEYMPPTLADLKSALHLEDSLTSKDEFDIVPDPMPSSGKQKRSLDVDVNVDAEAAANGGDMTLAATSNKNKRVLRSLYPAHSYSQSKNPHASFTSTPLSTKAFQGPTAHYVRLEYQMLFQPGFKWVKGGKLPGILVGTEEGCGGNAGCSGGGTAENCFSTRMMWRANGEGELYLYAAKSVYFPSAKQPSCSNSKRRLLTLTDREQEEELAQRLAEQERRRIDALRLPEPDDEFAVLNKRAGVEDESGSCLNGYKVQISPGAKNECNPTYGISIGRGGRFQFKSGHWHNVTQVVRLNSKGKAVKDGYLAVYLDGYPVIKSKDLVLLKNGYDSSKNAPSHQVKFMFSSFFGGHTKDYATPVKQWIAWKDFSMASSPTNLWG
ncbi:hypothetical protein EMPS_05256 [Entomortierella parvispora]|uniref:Polysaccharide lyase 14 domain-containing protein n=1 Tax=Entomortierella parvispora TaxID=205924 RepID=A0A9P3HAI6_9FUNG|nr:hypothetical protein EMPS_05256 [Entomortierella parvispora]